MKKGTGWLLLGSFLVLILIIVVVKSYSSLSSTKEDVINRESDLNVQLTRKKEQISNLVKVFQESTSDNEELLNEIESISKSIVKGSIKDKSKINNKITSLLNQLFENTSLEFLKEEKISTSIDEILSTEKRINTAITNYNNAVDDFNGNVGGFPSSIIAKLRGFDKKELFDLPIEVKDLRKSEIE